MEEAESYNWVIYPSKQQKITECALVLVGLLILAPVLSVFALSASAVCFFLFLFILWRQRSVIELQRYPTSWHLRHHSLIRDIQWRSGSVRRKSLVIWRYGKWPWQRVVIYPDSVRQGEFRLLLKALYQE